MSTKTYIAGEDIGMPGRRTGVLVYVGEDGKLYEACRDQDGQSSEEGFTALRQRLLQEIVNGIHERLTLSCELIAGPCPTVRIGDDIPAADAPTIIADKPIQCGGEDMTSLNDMLRRIIDAPTTTSND